jgi:trehalose 6-phosphate synthase/phosphatase
MHGELRAQVSTEKVVLSIDRLDYTKGIINRLEAFEHFLDKCPEWHDRVAFALVTVPSRVAVEHYQETKRRIDELVGRINGRFGSYLDPEELVALYRAGDVALITPLRDGMNLIAKEYVACRVDEVGVLVLSETAGAADELARAILVNPNSREEVAGAIKRALEMPLPEQRARNREMRARLRSHDVAAWARDFLEDLGSARAKPHAAGVLGFSPR